MIKLVWYKSFTRAYKKAIKKNPELRDKLREALEIFVDNPHHPLLGTHKLSGKLKGHHAFSLGYDCRVEGWPCFQGVRSILAKMHSKCIIARITSRLGCGIGAFLLHGFLGGPGKKRRTTQTPAFRRCVHPTQGLLRHGNIDSLRLPLGIGH